MKDHIFPVEQEVERRVEAERWEALLTAALGHGPGVLGLERRIDTSTFHVRPRRFGGDAGPGEHSTGLTLMPIPQQRQYLPSRRKSNLLRQGV